MSTLIQKILKSAPGSKLTEKAFKFAKEAHRGQKRSSGEDYFQHPTRVAQILKEMHLDQKTIAAGLLHDVPDDTDKTLEDIEKEFSKEIAFLVEGVSKLGKLRYPKEGLEVKPVEERVEEPIDFKAENLRKMFFAMAEDLRVVLIKLADRLHNMETLGFLPPEKQKRIALETLEIFVPMADRLGMGEMKAKLEDLAFPYLYPKEYEWLIQNVKEKYENRKRYLEKLQPVLKELLKKSGVKPSEISSRAKSYWSLYQKLLKHEMNFDRIHDLIALRVVVEDVKTCYEVLGIIHKFWKPLPGKIKDYIAFPKPNNYQALHTTCFCLDGKITEIQIKTQEMQKEAKNGICAHWAMKEGIDLKTQGKRFAWVQQLKNWQEEVSKSKEFLEGLKIDFFKNRIFVFTPKGDVIDLPEGATPVDFAYAVHTDVGNQCAAAKINGKMSSLSLSLKNGDVVEIITDKNKKPSRDWLEFIKTSFARTRVKRWLKSESRPENLKRGVQLLNQEFQKMKGIAFEDLPQTKKEELLKIFSFKNLEGLMVAVGEGEMSPREIFKSLFKEREIFTPLPQKSHPKLGDSGQVLLAGEKGIKIHLAKCCCPQPEDEIKAWINKERGASIHKTDCDNLTKAQKKWPQRIIEASWSKREKVLYVSTFEIKAEDRVGLFRDVSSVISGLGINILSCQAEPPKEKLATLRANVEISGLEELDKLFGQLKQVRGVLEVRKI
jgi:GTP pyrophosphokinase